MTHPRLFLNHIANFDWLIAVEYGRVEDGQAPDHWRGVSEEFGYLLDRPEGREVGFKVLEFSDFDPADDGVEEALNGPDAPRFDVPVLGKSAVTATTIIDLAGGFFAGEDSVNRNFFDRAIECNGEDLYEQALYWWRACLQAGDSMAHFAIGYTLYDLGRYEEAIEYLRHYVEISPHGAWNWCWLGKGAQALGNADEARHAYERAIELTEVGEDETDAPELLAGLDDEGESHRQQSGGKTTPPIWK